MQEPLYKDRAGAIRPKFSLEPAKGYGELAYVLNWSDPHELSTNQMLWKIRKALAGMQSNDYLLMVGNPTAMALVALVAGEITNGCFRLLYWDNAPPGAYRVEEVDLHAQPM